MTLFHAYFRVLGIVLIVGGICGYLFSWGYLPRNPKKPKEWEQWRVDNGKLMTVISPFMFLGGILFLTGILP